MAWIAVTGERALKEVSDLFADGAKLISVRYTACNENSDVNDVKSATLSFRGKETFSLKFTDIDCLHVAPIAVGSIVLRNVAVGTLGDRIFWADDGFFDVTEPDTSLTYVIGKGLFIEK